jgi:hypothetical protein
MLIMNYSMIVTRSIEIGINFVHEKVHLSKYKSSMCYFNNCQYHDQVQ